MTWFILAAEAAPTAAPDAGNTWWAWASLLLGGVVVQRLFAWVSDWLHGKGEAFIKKELEDMRVKLNATALGGQIKADDAVIDALEAAIPELLTKLNDGLKNALLDGTIKSEEIKLLAASLWDCAKQHIQGGAFNYLKESSFADGAVVAEMVLRRWLGKKVVEKAP